MATKISSKSNNSVASDDVEKKDEKETSIDISISLDKLSLRPKKKLLVLPLAGIIVYRAHRSRPNTFPKNRRPDFSYGSFHVYKRPFCKEFLEFCFQRFHVALWSAAREYNLQGILDHVMGDRKRKLLFTWDQEQCTDTGFMCLDRKDKPLFLKQLDYIWQNKYSNLPWRAGGYSPSNTLLITDPVKALLNPPNNGIFPETYDPEYKEDRFLGPNGELRMFLEGLSEAKDVPTYVKDHRIGQPPIIPDHSDWGYYSKIVRAFEKKGTTDDKI
uniref:uncharacterized protein LOC122581058 isoform X1 n=1 Tax=Erigeron canadensis TaxID=72917 RepID=UPI001CB97FC7|nr:uncharacterized protein LOC122581058 isoform X1 [Erigeron canadensis]